MPKHAEEQVYVPDPVPVKMALLLAVEPADTPGFDWLRTSSRGRRRAGRHVDVDVHAA
jgi:hypothetical protein